MIELNVELNKQLRDYICEIIPNITQYLDSIFSPISKELDFNKFKSWCDAVNFNSKSNPITYFKKVFIIEYQRGRFDREYEVVDNPTTPSNEDYNLNLTPLFNDMRKNDIVVEQNDTLYLDIFFRYILKNKILTVEELRESNHKAMKYIITNGFKSSTNFIELFKKSKTLSGKVDYDVIQKEYETELAEWNSLTNELDNGYHEMTVEEALDYEGVGVNGK